MYVYFFLGILRPSDDMYHERCVPVCTVTVPSLDDFRYNLHLDNRRLGTGRIVRARGRDHILIWSQARRAQRSCCPAI
jgi:hypothetical protein